MPINEKERPAIEMEPVKRRDKNNPIEYGKKGDLYDLDPKNTKKEMKKLVREYKILEFTTNMHVMDFKEKVSCLVNYIRKPSEINFIDPNELTLRQTDKLETLVDELEEFTYRMDRSKEILEDYSLKVLEEIQEHDEKFSEATKRREKYSNKLAECKKIMKENTKSSKEYAQAFKQYLETYKSYYEATNDCIVSSKKRNIREKEMDELGRYWQVSYSMDHLLKLQQADVEKLEDHLQHISPILQEIGKNVRKNYSVQNELEKTAKQLRRHKEFLKNVYNITRKTSSESIMDGGSSFYGASY